MLSLLRYIRGFKPFLHYKILQIPLDLGGRDAHNGQELKGTQLCTGGRRQGCEAEGHMYNMGSAIKATQVVA